jgi:electron transfer flavoprotein alpha subunit
MAEDEGILICGELVEGKLTSVTVELLGIGRKLADELGVELGVVFVGSGLARITFDEGIAFGADKVYVVDNPLLKDYRTDSYVIAMHDVCRELRPDIVLLGQTSLGRDLAPRLAFSLRAGLVMDCTDLKIDGQSGLLVRTKPVYGGNALACFVSETKPQIATVRAKSMTAAEYDSSRKGEINTLEITFDSAMIRTRVVARMEDEVGVGKRLETADVVVCGGRGIGSAENFTYLEQLARLLNGAVGSTRPPCDLGWAPAEIQIGLSGKVVAPTIYIGVALSGSSAHLAGSGNSKNIFAINNDPEANIFKVAHYGIVGDFRKVLPIIIEACKKRISG